MQNNMPTQPDNRDAALTRLIASYIIAIGPNGAPSGEVYVRHLGHTSLDKHYALINALREVGLITDAHHYIRLTERGLEKHAQLAALLMKTEVTL